MYDPFVPPPDNNTKPDGFHFQTPGVGLYGVANHIFRYTDDLSDTMRDVLGEPYVPIWQSSPVLPFRGVNLSSIVIRKRLIWTKLLISLSFQSFANSPSTQRDNEAVAWSKTIHRR